jgi:hypothetical protein
LDTSVSDSGTSLYFTEGGAGAIDQLYQLNPKTGLASYLGSAGVTGIAGSAIVDGYQELFQYNAGADHIYIAPPQLTNQLAPSDSCTFVLIWNGALRITPIRIDVNLSLFLSASCTIERITGMS